MEPKRSLRYLLPGTAMIYPTWNFDLGESQSTIFSEYFTTNQMAMAPKPKTDIPSPDSIIEAKYYGYGSKMLWFQNVYILISDAQNASPYF